MKERNPKLNLPEEVPEDSILEELPPRILKHAGKKSKTSKIYSITLVWLFITLVVILIVWGYQNN
jgi:hypothetical protein